MSNSLTVPWSKTTMRSLSRMVLIRCATAFPLAQRIFEQGVEDSWPLTRDDGPVLEHVAPKRRLQHCVRFDVHCSRSLIENKDIARSEERAGQ